MRAWSAGQLPSRLVVGVVTSAALLSLPGSQPAASPSGPPDSDRTTGPGGVEVSDASGPGVATAAPLRVTPLALGVLRPGVEQPLDVMITNTDRRTVQLNGVTVRVQQVRTPRASPRRPCGLADFRTRPSRFAGIRLAAGATVSLSRAGVPRERWPAVAMVDTATNQDGCQGARLVLDVRVDGRGR